jgi:hypothetical protein
LESQAGRANEFYEQLPRIEYQSARLAENPNFELDLDITRDLMKEKSINLMTGIVEFFDAALLYFNDNFFRTSIFCQSNVDKLFKEISAPEFYKSGTSKLDAVIKEYDQAVLDLTAKVVMSNPNR